jgi:hypothetical protein
MLVADKVKDSCSRLQHFAHRHPQGTGLAYRGCEYLTTYLPRTLPKATGILWIVDSRRPEMADSPQTGRLVAEISLLRKQQLESIENATFFGWSPEAKADHEKRADRIQLLILQLAKLDKTL